MNPVTQSEITTWLSCRRKHRLSYVEGLRRKDRPLALAYGSAWHEALRRYYSAPTASAEEEVRANVLAAADLLDPQLAADVAGEGPIEYPSEWAARKGHLPAMLCAHLRAYMETYSRHEWSEIAFVEQRLETTYCGVTLSGKPDGLVRDRHGFWWLLEHKTAASIRADTVLNLWTDFQVSFYLLLCRLVREHGGMVRSDNGTTRAGTAYLPGRFPEVEGVVYNVARKPALRPSKMQVLCLDGEQFPSRTQAAAVAQAEAAGHHVPKSRAFLARQETLDEYEARVRETVLAEPERHFLRETVTRSPEHDAEFQVNLQRILFEMPGWNTRTGSEYANPQHCPRCQFRPLCTAPESARAEVRETLYATKEKGNV